MKSKMRKKMIAFLLCMVLVICNSVSILADTPAEATTTVEKQTKQAGAVKETSSEAEKKEIKAGDADDTKGSPDSDSPEESKTTQKKDESGAPETKTTETKEDTTKATTETKEDSNKSDEVTTEEKKDSDKADEVTTKAKEETTEASDEKTTEKATTEAAEETSTTGEKEETDEITTAEESSETDKSLEEVTESTSTEKTEVVGNSETTAAAELKYEDEEVIITVSANEENAIPADTALKVVPIRSDNTATQAQYTEVEKQLQEKAEKEDYTTLGFLAYDITFTDAQGNEVESSGQVTVNMSYKKAVLPAEINAKSEEAADAEVTVLHLEEDANKQVQNVANLAENNQLQN